MTSRITDRDLKAVVDRINCATNSPAQPYALDAEGRSRAQVGCYHLSHAYGGVALHRIHSEGDAITDTLRTGHVTKRELYNLMHAFLSGLEAGE